MKKAPSLAEASPYKSVAQELEVLRVAFRLACRQYAERMEGKIAQVHERVVAAGTAAAEKEKTEQARPAGASQPTRNGMAARTKAADLLSQVHDLRDMLTLLRTMQIKPQEGRRKDLKKIEEIISDLALLTADWA